MGIVSIMCGTESLWIIKSNFGRFDPKPMKISHIKMSLKMSLLKQEENSIVLNLFFQNLKLGVD